MDVFGFAGYSGAGKTTLIERLIPLFVARGLKVSVIKHAHERFDVDRPGKDSYRHREAGATEILLASPHRWVLMHERRGEPEEGLAQQLARLSPCDLVLVEGYKHWPIPKLEVWRPASGKPRWRSDDRAAAAVAVATDDPAAAAGELPVLDLNDPPLIAGWILEYLNRTRQAAGPGDRS